MVCNGIGKLFSSQKHTIFSLSLSVARPMSGRVSVYPMSHLLPGMYEISFVDNRQQI